MVLVVKDLLSDNKSKLVKLLQKYKDVFAWLFEDMKGLDLAFSKNQFNLYKNAKLVQQ